MKGTGLPQATFKVQRSTFSDTVCYRPSLSLLKRQVGITTTHYADTPDRVFTLPFLK